MPVAGFKVIDCHHHVGSLEAQGLNVPGAGSGTDPRAVELQRRFEAMDNHGIDQAVVIPGHGYLRPDGAADTRRVNDAIAAYRDAHPDRFPAALGIVEPMYGKDACASELRRMRDELGLVGVSVHARFQGVTTDSPLVLAFARVAAEIGLVPFVHAVDGVPDEAMWRVQQVARAIPDTTVVVLDSLSGSEHARQACIMGADTPNLVFDVSLAHHFMFVTDLLDAVGPERVVFGTDYYSMMHAPLHAGVLDDIVASSMPDAHKAAILAGNLERVLGIATK
jgi:predicted TIM-barrel fold metal-dependent hydrolase